MNCHCDQTKPNMPPKQRSPDDVHDIFNVEVGKPYRGSMVEKIDIETKNLDNGKVKVRRLMSMDSGIILIEDTWHEYGDVFKDGKLLPYEEINFPSMDPADFEAPVRTKNDDDDDEKKKKRELLRQKAKDMMKKPSVPDNDGDGKLKIKVKTPDGKILPVVVNKDDIVGDIKEKVENDHGIPVDEQELSRKGKPLDQPNATMDDCGIENGDTLDLEPADDTFTVRVRTPDGRKHNVDVQPTDTVLDLMETIEKDLDIPVEDQKLSCSGEPLDNPASTMDDNAISNGAIIDVSMGDISVNIRTPDDRSFAISTKPDDTVGGLKKAIQSKQGIPVKDQNLDFEGKPLNDPSATMNDLGVSDGDTLDLGPSGKNDTKIRKRPDTTSSEISKPKAKDRKRVLNPDSAWVFPTQVSAPNEGEEDNLQGVWSIPPGKGSETDPVEVNIHPKNKEPKSDGKTDIHGAYGYINGAKQDANGVVHPANVVFYPPGEKGYSPDFDHVGWWSAPNSSSKTTVSWRFKGMDCLNIRTRTVNVMGHEMTFIKEWTE